MPKCDFNKLRSINGCSSVNLLHIFRRRFPISEKAKISNMIYRFRKFNKSVILQFFAWLSKVCETLNTLQFMKKV